MMKEILPYQKSLSPALPILILFTATFLFFGDVLLTERDIVLSAYGTDLSNQFVYWREFGFSQLKQGNLALWNPHLFSGAPYLGGFQSALLYPPNWLHLFVPLARAINAIIALHVFLLGLLMYLWMAHRQLHPLACLVAAIITMFSGAYFPHVYAGHLPNLCTMVWAPLIFFCIDRLLAKPALRWHLLGIFAVAMQILAGHPQYVYYTFITATIYLFVNWASLPAKRTKKTLGGAGMGLLIIYFAGGLLSAVQIFTGLQASAESVRSIGLPYTFAAMFSFPPENLLTVFSPWFFGDMSRIPYWGRCYFWEMSLFMGLSGVLLATLGTMHSSPSNRHSAIAMIAILVILALGVHLPLYQFLHAWFPGYDKFRGTSKFIFFATLFMAMLAAMGMHHLLEKTKRSWKTPLGTLGLTLLLLAASLWMQTTTDGASGPWHRLMAMIGASGESYLPSAIFTNGGFIRISGTFAAKQFVTAAAIGFIFSLLLMWRVYRPRTAAYAIALLVAFEMMTFAYVIRPTFLLTAARMPALENFARSHPEDVRSLNLVHPNSALSSNMKDIWGLDPAVPLRYAQFMAFIQKGDPDKPSQYVNFREVHPLFAMLRCRYVITMNHNNLMLQDLGPVMPRFNLVHKWRVRTTRDGIFRDLSAAGFDPRQEAILERSPQPRPALGATGTISIEETATDFTILRLSLSAPSLLLITDSYSKGWQAIPLAESTQNVYEVLPANYTLMAVPLERGYHHIMFRYAPPAFTIGKWVSICALILYILTVGYFALRRGRSRFTGSRTNRVGS